MLRARHWWVGLMASIVAAAFVAVLDYGARAEGSAAFLFIPRATSEVTIDGRLDDWPGTRPGWAFLSWDPTYLYLGVQVEGEEPNGGDDRDRDFRGGDRVVLVLGSEPLSGLEAENRLLGEREFAFIFAPDAPAGKALKTLFGFGGAEHIEFDLRQVAVAAISSAAGYALEARLPWSALGVLPSPGVALAAEVLVFDVRQGKPPAVSTLSGGRYSGSIGTGVLRPAVLVGQ